MITVYGISNCDSIRKTTKWLGTQGLEFILHDYRKNGLDRSLQQQLLEAFDLQELVNRRGTSWRQLDSSAQAALADPSLAGAVLRAQPALIRRPIVRTPQGEWLMGYEAVLRKFAA